MKAVKYFKENKPVRTGLRNVGKKVGVVSKEAQELYDEAVALEKTLDDKAAAAHRSQSLFKSIRSALALDSTQTQVFRKYKEAAEKGHAGAQYKYAWYLEVQEKKVDAFDWYLKAAEAGEAAAAARVAEFYYGGLAGLDVDVDKAFTWSEAAAADHNPAGLVLLARLYLQGKGIEKSEQRAVELLEEAVKHHSPSASAVLGMLYYTGCGVDQSYAKAVELFNNVVSFSEQHKPEIESDCVAESFDGEGEALFTLGCCYSKGEGVEANPSLAFKYYKLAASFSYPEGMLEVGIALQNGDGVTSDKRKAKFWMEEAESVAHSRKNLELEKKAKEALQQLES